MPSTSRGQTSGSKCSKCLSFLFYLSLSLDLKRIQDQNVCRFPFYLTVSFYFANGANFKEQASDLPFIVVFAIVIHFCLCDLYLPSSFTTATYIQE